MSTTVYDNVEHNGVICLTISALISLCAILCLLVFNTPRPSMFKKTHLFGYIMSLLVANLCQSVGTLVNFRWVVIGGISQNLTCEFQAVAKHFGDLAAAFWTCVITIHIFALVFFGGTTTSSTFVLLTVFGWAFIAFLVTLGPAAIQTSAKGSFFGVSGAWCSIRKAYPLERVFLAYFLELLAGGISLCLCAVIVLRLRRQLVISRGKWRFYKLPQEESFTQDLVDSSIWKISRMMVWLPVVYMVLLLPLSIARLSQYTGQRVPFGATTFTAVLFNAMGLANVILIMLTQRRCSDLSTLPQYDNPHEKKRKGRKLITPFTLGRDATPHQPSHSVDQNAFVALPQPARINTNDVERRSDLYYRSPDSTLGNHLY